MDFKFPENATPLSDYSGLILPWVQNLQDLNRAEAENIAYAQRKYLRMPVGDPTSWFQFKKLKAIHRTMFGKVWEWGGKQRTSITSIGVAPGLIATKIAELCTEVASWSQDLPIELTFLEKAARIHHDLVFIHPFENGNGRFARLVADRYLLAWKCPYPIWPENLHQKGRARKTYIQALQAADYGDYEPLICFMKELGACDPELNELLQNRFYKPHLRREKGIAKVKALLRRGASSNNTTIQLATRKNLPEIAALLRSQEIRS